MAHLYTAIIVGTGFGGISAARALRAAGIDDFVMLERRPFLGGTWRQNAYPGAAVDVQSPLYSLSGEPWDWEQMFASGEQLRDYTAHLLDKHRIHELAWTGAEVRSAAWSDDEHTWTLALADGREVRGRYVINASGPLSQPHIPAFEGLDRFDGPAFHTNDWRHDVPLDGRRVAVIGSGASAAQVIPAIVERVGELHVFQRSPHWVMPRPDHTFSALERRLLRNPAAYRALREAIYWGLETRVIGFKYSETMLRLLAERAARKLLRTQVADPELRRRLTPEYTIGCKRIILSNTLYPALCHPHTTLHDRSDGIERFDAEGIRTTGGQHVPVDVVVFATGYDAATGLVSYDVQGRDGERLADAWAEFPRAYLGTTVPSFPNFFVVTGPNTGIGHTSALFIIEAQMTYIRRCLREVEARGALAIDVRPDAEQAYTERIHREMQRTVWQSGGCTSWYQTPSGRVVAMFPGFSFTYRRWTRRFRDEDHVFVRD